MKSAKYILLFVILSYYISANGQYRRNFRGFGIQSNIEFGLGLGTSNYQGDLSVAAFTWELTKMNIGGFVRAKPFENIAFRAGINFGKVAGDDKAWGKLYNEYDFKYGAGSVQ